MRLVSKALFTAALAAMAYAAPVNAAVSVTQAATAISQPSATTINFDEYAAGVLPKTLTQTTYSSLGVKMIGSDGNLIVESGSATVGTLDTTNVLYSDYGIEYDFSTPLTSLSISIFDPSGPGGPFGGGLYFHVYKGAAFGTELNTSATNLGNGYTPAWAGSGNADFNVTTSGGSTFDKIIIQPNGGFDPESYTDNLSFTTVSVPEPTSLGLLGLSAAGLLGRRRRSV